MGAIKTLLQRVAYQNWFIVLAIVTFFPIGIYLMFKKGWSRKAKSFAFGYIAICYVIFTLAAIFAPPSIKVASLQENKSVDVRASSYELSGSVYPYSSVLTVNGKTVTPNKKGSFSTSVPLNEGDNIITVKAVDDNKTTLQHYKIHRYTKQELADQARHAALAKELAARQKAASDQKKQAAAAAAHQQELAVATAAAKKAAASHNPENYWYLVTDVVDGDTLKVRISGKIEKIRIIGINSPESTIQHECYGDEASNYAKKLMTNRWIKFKADPTQANIDKYGRLLRYIYYGGNLTDFGKQMIAEGYAYEYTYDNPYQHRDDYLAAQASAKKAGKGLWAANTCDGQKTKPAATTAPKSATTPSSGTYTAPAPAPATPSGCDPNYAGACVPIGSDVDCAWGTGNGPLYFSGTARVVGSDIYGLDRNHDGIACNRT